MALGSEDDFSSDELALIPPPEPEEQAQMDAEDAAAAQQAKAKAGEAEQQEQQEQQQDAQQTETPAAAPAEAAQAEAAAPEQKPQGDVRAALRAARRAEAKAREQAEQERKLREELQRKLEELGHKSDGSDDEVSDDDIERLAEDFDPAFAKIARLAKRAAQAAAAKPAPVQEQQEFMPPWLPPELQEAVDSVPELLTWQHEPDQQMFEKAKAQDAYLATLDAWKDKPAVERFQEVVRRVNADIGRVTPPPTANTKRADPRAVIEQLPSATPNTLSDLPGSGGKQPATGNNLQRYEAMTEEQIFAELMRGG
jgi:hypothetical protein